MAINATSDQLDQDLLFALKDIVEAQAWQCLGPTQTLKQNSLRRLYGDCEGDDVVLIYNAEKNTFHAMDAVCSHEGGPLELGDIEEINGQTCIVCPWHHFEFCLDTGYSDSSGLQQDLYPLMKLNGQLYMRCGENELSFTPKINPRRTAENVCDIAHVSEENSLCDAAYKILITGDPHKKMALSIEAGENWLSGKISDIGETQPPHTPSRSDQLSVVKPGKETRRGKGGTLASRISILHSMANIELWAVDLTWDIIARFVPKYRLKGQHLPKEFTDDFIKIALDETKHFQLLSKRLTDLGSQFGALTVHNGLWESAEVTNADLLARLAVVHMVHEARGLDVQPTQIRKFKRQGDTASLGILKIVYEEEITHVAAGLKWFNYICNNSEPALNAVDEFHRVVKQHFKGYLKPPFNTEARQQAGMTPEWYEPLTKPKPKQTSSKIDHVSGNINQGGML